MKNAFDPLARVFLAALLAVGGAGWILGCDDDEVAPIEREDRTEERTEDPLDEAGDEAEDAVDDAGDAVDDATDNR